MRTVYVGHAASAEDGSLYGVPGDQTGRECRRDQWFAFDWQQVFRPKSSVDAQNIATAMSELVANDNIGYSQKINSSNPWDPSSRRGGYALYLQNGRISAINQPCNVDCSTAVQLSLAQAGIVVTPDIDTSAEPKLLRETGRFDEFNTPDYTNFPDKLKAGDILVRRGHTAIVVAVEETAEPVAFKQWIGMATTLLNVRTAPAANNGTFFNPRKYVKQYQEVLVIGKEANGWLKVMIGSPAYEGYVSGTYISKVRDVEPAPTPEPEPVKREITVGSTVRFTGDKVYASSYKNGKAKGAEHCIATVTRTDGNYHKFHIKSSSGVEGWANESDLQLI